MVEGSGLCFDFPDFEVGLIDVECAWAGYSGTWDWGDISSVGTTEEDVNCSSDTDALRMVVGSTLEGELEWDREQEVCI